jgi:hypothetical protein
MSCVTGFEVGGARPGAQQARHQGRSGYGGITLNKTHQFLPDDSRPNFASRSLGDPNTKISKHSIGENSTTGFYDSSTTQKQD